MPCVFSGKSPLAGPPKVNCTQPTIYHITTYSFFPSYYFIIYPTPFFLYSNYISTFYSIYSLFYFIHPETFIIQKPTPQSNLIPGTLLSFFLGFEPDERLENAMNLIRKTVSYFQLKTTFNF